MKMKLDLRSFTKSGRLIIIFCFRTNFAVVLLGMAFNCTCIEGLGQKPPLDTSAFSKWPKVRNAGISNDGKYAYFTVENEPVRGRTLIIKATDGHWKREFQGVSEGDFDVRSQSFFFLKEDTMCNLDLHSGKIEYTPDVISYKLVSDSGQWLVCLAKSRILFVEGLSSGKKWRFNNTSNFLLGWKGCIFVETSIKGDSGTTTELKILSLRNEEIQKIWSGFHVPTAEMRIANFTIDNSREQVAFLEQKIEKSSTQDTIWYFKRGMERAEPWVTQHSMPNGYSINSQADLFFGKNGHKLFCKIRQNEVYRPKDRMGASVDVWNYKDEVVLPAQAREPKLDFWACVRVGSESVLRLEAEKDQVYVRGIYPNSPVVGDFLLCEQDSFRWDYWWHKGFSQSLFLISTATAVRREILHQSKDLILDCELSPDEKFVLWYNASKYQYFTYQLATGKIRNVSKDIPYPLFDDSKTAPVERSAFGLVGWMDDGSGILIYDRYDIWLIDPKGERLPENLTKGYGRKHNIILGIADFKSRYFPSSSDTLLLAGFSQKTKKNGFFVLEGLGQHRKLLLGSMLPFSFCIPRIVPYVKGLVTGYDHLEAGWPVKAKNAQKYLVFKMSAEQSPNVCLTDDFVNYKQISEVCPEKQYKWMTSELVSWRKVDGTTSQGILYKPEDFDPSKKYPVIFQYYEDRSDALHVYLLPWYSNATINIPYYVSNGYIVFVPDIVIKKEHPGDGIMNSIISGAAYLATFPWVETKKFGAQGQSFGGYETNYIITHCNLFAAACEGSGTSDLASSYGQLGGICDIGSRPPRQLGEEIGQGDLGSTPWQRPNLFVGNSPIFAVDKITTPLLIWHSRADKAVPFEQGVEMFLDMRRAGKKVWLLQYDGDEHAATGRNAVDLNTRMKQFFDYYLKGMIAPEWMTLGVPAYKKGSEYGLQADTTGRRP